MSSYRSRSTKSIQNPLYIRLIARKQIWRNANILKNTIVDKSTRLNFRNARIVCLHFQSRVCCILVSVCICFPKLYECHYKFNLNEVIWIFTRLKIYTVYFTRYIYAIFMRLITCFIGTLARLIETENKLFSIDLFTRAYTLRPTRLTISNSFVSTLVQKGFLLYSGLEQKKKKRILQRRVPCIYVSVYPCGHLTFL